MFPPLFQVAAADTSVASIFGVDPTRIFAFGEADQRVKPYAVWQIVTGLPFNSLGAVPDADSFGTQIDVYANTAADARAAATALINALEAVAHVTAYNGEYREADTRDYRYSFTVDWIVNR